jgi:hypothetical protein
VRRGQLRDELGRIALGQGLAHDAAFVAIGVTAVATLDDHEYRETQLAAGLAEGRFHLAAYALGAAASGMTFLDSEIPGLIGEPLDALQERARGVEPRCAGAQLPRCAADHPRRPADHRPVRQDRDLRVQGKPPHRR